MFFSKTVLGLCFFFGKWFWVCATNQFKYFFFMPFLNTSILLIRSRKRALRFDQKSDFCDRLGFRYFKRFSYE